MIRSRCEEATARELSLFHSSVVRITAANMKTSPISISIGISNGISILVLINISISICGKVMMICSRSRAEGFYFQRFGSTFFLLKVRLDTPSRFLVTVIIFGLLDTKSVNCHRDRGGHGRHPRNCRRFSTLG